MILVRIVYKKHLEVCGAAVHFALRLGAALARSAAALPWRTGSLPGRIVEHGLFSDAWPNPFIFDISHGSSWNNLRVFCYGGRLFKGDLRRFYVDGIL